jgi:streptogramin lyase
MTLAEFRRRLQAPLIGSVGLIALALAGTSTALGQNWKHTDYPIPIPNSTAYGIATGPDGNLWFGASGKMYRLSPAGAFTAFDTPDGTPFAVTAGPDGKIWYNTSSFSKPIGTITTTGVVSTFDYPLVTSPGHITGGPDGNVWFTVFCDDALYRITPTGVVTRFPVPTAGACAYGLTTGPDGNIWFTEHYRNKIGRMTPGGVVTEFRIGPVDAGYPDDITAGPDGNLWATDNYGQLHKIATDGTITEIPSGSNFGSITSGDGYLWTGSSGNVQRVSTSGQVLTLTLPDADHSPLAITFGPDGAVWFPEAYTGSIGRVGINPGFFTVDPCRLIDTRVPPSIPLAPGDRTFAAVGSCGLPDTARAVALNVTVVDPSGSGHLVLYPSASGLPPTSSLNYSAGQVRANNAIVTLGPDGSFVVYCVQFSGTADLVVDVSGYFQ